MEGGHSNGSFPHRKDQGLHHHVKSSSAGHGVVTKGERAVVYDALWNYTTRGLAAICKEGTDCIGSALKELEKTGYIVRNRLRDNKGKIVDVEYVIYETPRKPDPAHPHEESPDADCPDTENLDMDNPGLENQPQLNKDISSNYQQKKDLSITDESNPIKSPYPHGNEDGKGWDGIQRNIPSNHIGEYRL